MRRKSFLATAIIAAAGLVLTGCGAATPQGSSSGQTIQVFSNFTPDVARGKVLDKLIAEFNKEHKGQYTVVSKSQPDWPTLAHQTIRGEAPPVGIGKLLGPKPS